MKNGNITFEDIAHHVPENWDDLKPEWDGTTKSDLLENLKKRVNATNRINAQAALKPTSLNRRCKEFQKYYAALSSLTFDQMQLYKQIFKNEKILKTLETKQVLFYFEKGLLTRPTPKPCIVPTKEEYWVPDREFICPIFDALPKSLIYQDLL
ncbi:MAG: hypothetical protein AAGU19_07890 [Prolixibacteraceae bacterium]